MRARCPSLVAALALVLVACSGGGAQEPDAGGETDAEPATTSLMAHDGWTPTSADDDPLADHRPDEVDCPDEATKVESLSGESSYAVNTQLCNYHSASQPSRAEIPAGATVRARIWHFPLSLPDGGPGEAHIALLFGDDLVWDERVEIPSSGQLLQPSWEAAEAYPEGTELIYHLHNHGDNEWNLIELVVEDG